MPQEPASGTRPEASGVLPVSASVVAFPSPASRGNFPKQGGSPRLACLGLYVLQGALKLSTGTIKCLA
jgi:hypothetical protein